MPRRLQVFLSLLISVAVLLSTLAVCDAHLFADQHPDCGQCLAIASSASRRDEATPTPTGPHHCPAHPCAHLHAPFLPVKGIAVPSPARAARLSPAASTLEGQDPFPPPSRPPQV